MIEQDLRFLVNLVTLLVFILFLFLMRYVLSKTEGEATITIKVLGENGNKKKKV